MTELELCTAREAVRRVLVDYAYAQDIKDWTAIAALLTEDVLGDYGGPVVAQAPGREIARGREAMLALHRKYGDRCGPTQHMLGNFRIDIEGGRATSRCYVRAMHVGTGYLRTTYYDLWGVYEDELVSTTGGWKICRRVQRAFHEVGNLSVFALEDDLA